jgi:hypothetical protein
VPPQSSFYQRIREFVVRRSTAYRITFPKGGRASDVVLADLARFCRAHCSTFHPDPHVAARLDGRREVWLRIVEHLNLSSDELIALYGGMKKDAEG